MAVLRTRTRPLPASPVEPHPDGDGFLEAVRSPAAPWDTSSSASTGARLLVGGRRRDPAEGGASYRPAAAKLGGAHHGWVAARALARGAYAPAWRHPALMAGSAAVGAAALRRDRSCWCVRVPCCCSERWACIEEIFVRARGNHQWCDEVRRSDRTWRGSRCRPRSGRAPSSGLRPSEPAGVPADPAEGRSSCCKVLVTGYACAMPEFR